MYRWRILPERWASTLCPFSSSTMKFVLGRASITVPSSSRTSPRLLSRLGLLKFSPSKRMLCNTLAEMRIRSLQIHHEYSTSGRCPRTHCDCDVLPGLKHLGFSHVALGSNVLQRMCGW